ncbi:MAG: TonB-dependent receptor, partial [Candidatus Eremiobacteraeota bacterium]|nr:TonB-dependent receptor [Candidatus Eremiobacteraeota bacterium]
MKRRFFAGVFAMALAAPGIAHAGTTGRITGTVRSTGGAPIAGATVTISSPSQTSAAQTDARGSFAFISVPPDTYSVTVTKSGFEPVSGIAVVQADQTIALLPVLRESLKTIASVKSAGSGSLVRPGTTYDVYSVNAQQQQRLAAMGGGGGLMSAYSAIQSLPGIYVPPNQTGFFQILHIRGGDYNQTGYEFDGISLNNSYNNYPPGPESSLGQQEVQVYAGSTPANSEGSGLAGYINQVIKTGTFPGYGTAELGLGTPSYFHSARVEVGGATPDRTVSYYVGLDGHNQTFRYVDQFNGAAYTSIFGTPIGVCPSDATIAQYPSCFTDGRHNISGYFGGYRQPGFVLGPITAGYYYTSMVADRNGVFNLHLAVPRKGGLRDDVQFLYDNNYIFTQFYSSPNDVGLQNYATLQNGYGVFPTTPRYSDTFSYNGPLGKTLTSNPLDRISPYWFPSQPEHAFAAPIPLDNRDGNNNNTGIFKLQYQHNFSSSAFARAYAYSYYWDYIATGPMSSALYYAIPWSAQYNIDGHNYGANLTFSDQISPQHLLSLQGNAVTSQNHYADSYQTELYYGGGPDDFIAVVDSNYLKDGLCYNIAGAKTGTSIAPTTCNPSAGAATFASLYQTGLSTMGLLQCPGGPAPPGLYTFSGACNGKFGAPLPSSVSNLTCGTGPCRYATVENGAWGGLNNVGGRFWAASLTDNWRPSDPWNVDAGVRLDSYGYVLGNTTGTPARAFWFAAYNRDTCANPGLNYGYPTDKTQIPLYGSPGKFLTPLEPCSAGGPGWASVPLYNVSGGNYRYNVFEPRAGATYTVSLNTVLRANWGIYSQQPAGITQQVDSLEQDLPFDTLGKTLASYGFNQPGSNIRPEVSYNADFSLEHRFQGTDVSMKLTPFLRLTRDQLEGFYINQYEYDNLNVGRQTSEGFELQLDKGDFNRNGLAAQLAFTYTNVFVNFGNLPNGQTVVTTINNDIGNYNAYTSACAAGGAFAGKTLFGQPVCGRTSSGAPAGACYSGVKVAPCTAKGSVANPYWNAPVQTLLDPSANYPAFDVFPGSVNVSSVQTFNTPYVAALILNYKHDKFALTPTLQLNAGNRYGAPEVVQGIDPAAGCTALKSPVAGDPRYPYGARGGAPFDAAGCAGRLPLPDPYTGVFDEPGSFRNPANLSLAANMSYAASPRITLNVALTNLVNNCFWGEQTKFTWYWGSHVCNYGGISYVDPSYWLMPVGNVYNPR